MSVHRRHRWLALLAIFCLLFQQLAMASYLCPQPAPPVADSDLPCHAPEPPDDPVRCAQHCSPVTPSADHAAAPTVPMLLPLRSWPLLLEPLVQAISERPHGEVLARATAPPLNIRDCSWQI